MAGQCGGAKARASYFSGPLYPCFAKSSVVLRAGAEARRREETQLEDGIHHVSASLREAS
jgi:hypothetical protein